MERQLKRKSLASIMGIVVLVGAGGFIAVRHARADGAKSAEPAAASQVKIDNFTFTAQSITVRVGTEVTWVNRDDIPHTDDKFSFKFSQPGTYHYFCSIHPKMTAEVVVK